MQEQGNFIRDEEIRRMSSSRCTAPPQWSGRSFERIRQKAPARPRVEAAQIVANESPRRSSSKFIWASGPLFDASDGVQDEQRRCLKAVSGVPIPAAAPTIFFTISVPATPRRPVV